MKIFNNKIHIYFQSKFLIIFAINELHKTIYDALAEEIYDSSVEILEPNAENIVKIISNIHIIIVSATIKYVLR